jgi:hypothetical protein
MRPRPPEGSVRVRVRLRLRVRSNLIKRPRPPEGADSATRCMGSPSGMASQRISFRGSVENGDTNDDFDRMVCPSCVSSRETELLLKERSLGTPWVDIAILLGRSRSAVRGRYARISSG